MPTLGADRNRPHSLGSGFTLPELLASIAIICVLTGILLPVVASTRAESRALLCQNNARQITLALLGYAGRSNSRFPPNIVAVSPNQVWCDDYRIGQYLQLPTATLLPDASVFACPDDDGSRRSYAMNIWASGKVDVGILASPAKGVLWSQNVKESPRMMLLVEAWSYMGTAAAGYTAPPAIGASGSAGARLGGGGGLPPFTAGRCGIVNSELTYARHRKRSGPGGKNDARGRTVMAFADGHVELLSNDTLVGFESGSLTGIAYWSPLDLP